MQYFTVYSDFYTLCYVAFDTWQEAEAHHDFILLFGPEYALGVYCCLTKTIIKEPVYTSVHFRRAIRQCVDNVNNKRELALDRK